MVAYEFSLGSFRLGSFAWKLSLRKFLFGCFVGEHSRGICRVKSFTQTRRLGVVRVIFSGLEYFGREQHGVFRLGPVTQEKLDGLGELGS